MEIGVTEEVETITAVVATNLEAIEAVVTDVVIVEVIEVEATLDDETTKDGWTTSSIHLT